MATSKRKKLSKEDMEYCDLLLANDCSVSKIAISPSDWNTNPKSINKTWIVYYRFKDPNYLSEFPTGKLIQARGMNSFVNYQARKAAARKVREDIKTQLVEEYFNPITSAVMEIAIETLQDGADITEKTSWASAMNMCIGILETGKDTITDMKSMMNFLSKSIQQLGYSKFSISQVKMIHLSRAIDACKKSPNRTNKYISYCSMIWKKFKALGVVSSNIVTDIDRKTVIKDETEAKCLLTKFEREEISEHLYKNCYTFWRFMQIFFHSGSRERELLRVKVKDVDIEKQRYKVLIKKRRVPTIVFKPIKDCILHLWKETIDGAPPEAYVFSDDLSPAVKENPIRGDQIGKRWLRWVKRDRHEPGSNGLGIKKDFYDIKHLHTTEIVSKVSEFLILQEAQKVAAELNAHTNTKMVDQVYDVDSSKRKIDLFNKLDIAF